MAVTPSSPKVPTRFFPVKNYWIYVQKRKPIVIVIKDIVCEKKKKKSVFLFVVIATETDVDSIDTFPIACRIHVASEQSTKAMCMCVLMCFFLLHQWQLEVCHIERRRTREDHVVVIQSVDGCPIVPCLRCRSLPAKRRKWQSKWKETNNDLSGIAILGYTSLLKCEVHEENEPSHAINK